MSKSVTLLIGNKIIFNSALKNCQTKQALEPNLITVLLHIYMASSVSVKVNWILSCDWLPEQARSLGFPVVFYKSVSVLLTYNKSFIDQAWSVKMTDIGLVLCLHTCLWNLTLSWSVRMQKNLADIQPSWPHTLPKTPMYYS